MDDAKWERWSALGGVVFVVLTVAAGFLPGTPPKTSDSSAKIADFVHDHRDAIRWQSVLGALGTIALLWFLGAVWRVLRRAEGGDPRLTVVAVLGAVFAAVLGAVGAIMLSVIGIVGVGGAGSAANLRTLYVLSTNLAFGVVIGVAVFLAAFSVVIVRTGVFPRWLGWIGLLIALVAVASSGVLASTRDAFFDLGFGGFVGSSVWVLIVSVMMVAGRGSTPATAASAT